MSKRGAKPQAAKASLANKASATHANMASGERGGVPPRAQPKKADDQRRRRGRNHRDVAQTAEQIHPRSVG